MRAFTLALAFAAALLFGNTAFAAQVKIGYTPSIDIAPIFVAIVEGFFAKRGLEVARKPTANPRPAEQKAKQQPRP